MSRRWLFPDDPFIFEIPAAGTPVYSAYNLELRIFADAGCTTLADIQHIDGTPVHNSSFMINETSTIPSFYGPPDVKTLWVAQVTGPVLSLGSAFAIYALPSDRLDLIETQLAQFGIGDATPVLSVNHITADLQGNIELAAADVGALTQDNADRRYVPYFYYVQNSPAASWYIVHGLGKYPSVTLMDMSGSQILADVQYPDLNSVYLTFPSPFAGSVALS